MKILGQEAKDMQEKVDEFEYQQKQDSSQLSKVQNARVNAKISSRYWKNRDAAVFGYWLIVLSSSNQPLWLYDNQYIDKDPETDYPVVPVIMVEKLDDTIDCIDNDFKALTHDKPERVL